MKSGEAVGMVKVGRITAEGKFEPCEDTQGGWLGRGEFAIELGEKNYYLDTYNVEDVYKRINAAVVPRLKKLAGFAITPMNIGNTRASVYVICD